MTDINPEEFPSNSDKSKEEVKKPLKRARRVVRGGHAKRLKSGKKSLMTNFFGEEVTEVGNYILHEVLIPAAKNTIQDMITNGIEMLLYGESGGSRRPGRKDPRRSIVSYDAYYKGDTRRLGGRSSEPKRLSYRGKSYPIGEIIIDNRGEANDVLVALEEILDEYDSVTVSDLYEIVGFDSDDWTTARWGWTDLQSARVVRAREGGYLLQLPPAIPLD
jgi:hypothetical protein